MRYGTIGQGEARPRRAVTFVEKLNGSSQPSVILTTGATLYVVKFREFTAKHGLMGEVVGAELMKRMGLPVPDWCPIDFAEEFLNLNPDVWYRTKQGADELRPSPGLHFGSRMMLSEGAHPTYEAIPAAWTSRIVNTDDFVGVLLLDLWTNNCDRRQSLFLVDSERSNLRAIFVDSDHCFGGFFGNEKTCPRRVMASSIEIYRRAWQAESATRWKKLIEAIVDDELDRILAKVPPAWADHSARQHVRSELQMRRCRLNSWMSEIEDALATAGPGQINSPIHAATLHQR